METLLHPDSGFLPIMARAPPIEASILGRSLSLSLNTDTPGLYNNVYRRRVEYLRRHVESAARERLAPMLQSSDIEVRPQAAYLLLYLESFAKLTALREAFCLILDWELSELQLNALTNLPVSELTIKRSSVKRDVLMPAFGTMSKLKSLNITMLSLSSSAVARLREALPNTRIIAGLSHLAG